ncbi:MAG TPA: MBL fold metallo-hydrolase [Bryobacteraceae bacterium]|nr:MBL fold metallo-hydrolase [Bryobacteraceae bacterium]
MMGVIPLKPIAALGLALLCVHSASAQTIGQPLPPWSPGTLDIHQIQTGRGNAAFLIFPDGTTLLVDAGEVPDRPGLEIGPARPNATRRPGEWIAQYIRDFAPRTPATLDYVLITHYHDDHMAAIDAVGRAIPIRSLLDRGETPAPAAGPLVDHYRQFRRDFGGSAETLRPGRADQIAATRNGRQYPGFEVRNVAVNGEIWTGQGDATRLAFPPGWSAMPKDLQPGENSFSAALRIRCGHFSYFTGGDLVGVPLDNLPSWHDLETPVARAIGAVDVLVLNHHGWLDTTNPFFLRTLQPRVVVVPAWHASHPDHGVLRRLVSPRVYSPADLFTTTLLDAPRAVFSYLREPFKSSEGHIVVRVQPGGAAYRVFILDDHNAEHLIRAIYGPYSTR